MNPNELRYGNFVMLKNDSLSDLAEFVGFTQYWIDEQKFFKIVGIDIHEILLEISDNDISDCLEFNYNEILPIPIDPQWLIDFGFEYTLENSGNMPCHKIQINNNTYIIAEWEIDKTKITKWQIWKGGRDICQVNYIHQLQNIIFAISKKELNLI